MDELPALPSCDPEASYGNLRKVSQESGELYESSRKSFVELLPSADSLNNSPPSSKYSINNNEKYSIQNSNSLNSTSSLTISSSSISTPTSLPHPRTGQENRSLRRESNSILHPGSNNSFSSSGNNYSNLNGGSPVEGSKSCTFHNNSSSSNNSNNNENISHSRSPMILPKSQLRRASGDATKTGASLERRVSFHQTVGDASPTFENGFKLIRIILNHKQRLLRHNANYHSKNLHLK